MTVGTGEERNPRAWRPSAVLGLVALVASAVFAGNPLAVRDRLLGSAVASPIRVAVDRHAGPADSTVPVKTVLRSEPWWQSVRTLQGSGPSNVSALAIASTALQWRVQWSCQSGHLAVFEQGRRRPTVDAGCPGPGVGYATSTGTTGLRVIASGSWKLQVDQQTDQPLDEPPLATMTAPGAAAASTGSIYRVDQVGAGTVTIYRLADGSYALRLGEFYVTPNTDLEVRLSPLAAPHSTDEYTAAPSMRVSLLDVTAGSLNFAIPADLDLARYHSVVLWCDRLHSVYAAATLSPAS
ncbi:MAG: DM13 domain-containing protein [Actinomycetota bacterium]|nr:DM13 domain-containing protein [Actinomycetota bacterium]